MCQTMASTSMSTADGGYQAQDPTPKTPKIQSSSLNAMFIRCPELFLILIIRHLLIHPSPPLLPLPMLQADLLALIPHDLQIHLLPIVLFAIISRLPHQAHQRFFLGPALFARNVRQICRAVPPVVICEGYAQTMGPERPVEGRGRGFEVCEECDGAFEGREFAGGNGVEACVVKGTGT